MFCFYGIYMYRLSAVKYVSFYSTPKERYTANVIRNFRLLPADAARLESTVCQ